MTFTIQFVLLKQQGYEASKVEKKDLQYNLCY